MMQNPTKILVLALSTLPLVLGGCPGDGLDPDSGVGPGPDSSVGSDSGTGADAGADAEADAGPESIAFWELASPWETRLRDKAEIPRIYLDHRGWVVVYADDEGERGEELFHTRVSQFSENRILLDNPENWVARQDLHLAVYDDQGVGNEFDAEDPLIIDRDGNPMEAVANLHFISSTTVEDSEFYYDNCTIEQYENNRTDLPVDCRCNEAQQGGQPICWPPGVSHLDGHAWGSGPRMADINRLSREAGGGFVDVSTREYVMTINWSDETYTQSAGAIWGVNVDTGARRVISGLNDTPTGYVTVGGGYESNVTVAGADRHTAPFPYIFDVKVGGDGFWYTYGADGGDNIEIIRVDPETGDRTLVWHKRILSGAHEEFGQCQRFPDDADDLRSVQYNHRSFTMDPAGNFYLSFRDSEQGDGIVRIDADGSACTPIMRMHGAGGLPDIGGGATFQSQNIRGISWIERPDHDPVIVMFTVLGTRLYSVDPDTGFRTLVSGVGDGDERGTGMNAMGNDWFVWDNETNLLWTAGGNSETLVVIDMDTGDRQNMLRLSNESPLYPGGYPVEHEIRGPVHTGIWSHSIFLWHPDNRDHVAVNVNSMSIGILELHTSNTYTFSM
ncbi:MAG: hypothetical protein AB8H86_09110 [Polyangiales bacterium]